MVSVILASCSSPLSEDELQKRAEDYALLVESLQSVGYAETFALRENHSLEENLRRLWLGERAFNDARKNAELLVSLGHFDFIAEGLKENISYVPSSKNSYYQDWPRDSGYVPSSRAVEFSYEEVLWLMLLLPDAAIPELHHGLREVLAERGGEALRKSQGDDIWPYFEKHYPGYLEQFEPRFWENYVTADMAYAFRNAGDDIQDRFIQSVDMERMRRSMFRPRLRLSLPEAEELLQEFPPTGAWDGGYLRVAETKASPDSARIPPFRPMNIYELRSDNVLAAVTHPADARFLILEEYTDKQYYSTYTWNNRDETFDVYLWKLKIRIVDLTTGKEFFRETKRGNPPPEKLSFFMSVPIYDGEYDHDDFDYDRYAEVIIAYINGTYNDQDEDDTDHNRYTPVLSGRGL